MLSAINNQHQPAFQAKLNFGEIKIPNSKAICEKFEDITKHYKNDTLDITSSIIPREEGSAFKCTNFEINGREIGFVPTLKEFKKFCRKHTPDEVAKSLSKVFKFGKHDEVSLKKLAELYKNLRSVNFAMTKAMSMPGTKTSEFLISSSSARLSTLEKQAKAESKRYADITDKIFGDDPINKIFYSND